MELVEVEITGQVITSQHGTLNTGAKISVTPAFAKHLIEECSAAKYSTKAKAVMPAPPKLSKAKKVAEPKKIDAAAEGVTQQLEPPPVDAAGAADGAPPSADASADVCTEPQTDGAGAAQ